MAGAVPYPLSPDVLRWARISMGLELEQAADKAGVKVEQYESWEKGEKSPTYRQLETLATKVFKRPLAILLLSSPPEEDTIIKDFRSMANVEVDNLSSNMIFALRRAKRFQRILDDISDAETVNSYSHFEVSLEDTPADAARRFRGFLNLELDEQKSWRPENSLKNFKQLIEDIGIYVFQFKMPIAEARAFCITGTHPIIVLNSDDFKNGKTFSLFHETCHVLFNTNGIFKDLKSGSLKGRYSEIEDFCNKFSSSFLVPDDAFESDLNRLGHNQVNENFISAVASSYKVSAEVIARKLRDRLLISEDAFWDMKKRWDNLAILARQKELDKQKAKDFHGRDQGIVTLTEKGLLYVSQVLSAYHQGTISTSDLSNFLETKLKNIPKIVQRLNV